MCYNIFFRKLFCLLFVFWGVVSIHAQQVTKEQLLKLFYQANAARSANQTDVAIKTYVDILKLSPGLPDPYLQLGDLYSAMTQDAVALEKACVCYENYLLLKPDASNAESLKTKISELTLNIKQLNAGAMQLVENQLQVSTDMANSQDTEKLLEETADVSVETLIEKKDTMQVIAADTNRIVPIVSNQPIDDALLGRWVSADLGADGREIWIFDISKDADNYCFALNDSSYIKKTNSILKNVKLLKAPAYVEGEALVMTYVVTQTENNSDANPKKRNSYGQILDDFLNMKIKFDLFSDSENKVKGNDTIVVDSAKQIVPILTHSYQFRLAYDGFKLNGTIAHKVVKKDSIETLLFEQSDNCELFKSPDDYLGFTYKPLISESDKANKMELQLLFHRKLQEAMENTSAINDLACMYASGVGVRRDMKMAETYFMEAAMKRNLFGTLNLAQLYVDGLGVEKDLDKAREYYKQAFEQGYSDAMVMCGDTYLISAVGEEDYKKAFDCYIKAVYRRCPYAYYRLGWLYKEGLGITKDSAKALEYYQKAVDMQYPDALVDVALFHMKGDLVEKDINKAMDLLTKAADKGNAKAMYELSQIYLRGEDGIKPNFKYAKDLYYRYVQANDKVLEGFNTIKTQVHSILSSKK